MASDPPNNPALPLEELDITPQWVKVTKSYAGDTGEDRERRKGKGGGPKDFPRRSDDRPRPRDVRRGPPTPPVADRRSPKAQQRGKPDTRKPEVYPPGRARSTLQRERPPQPAPVEVAFLAEEKGLASMLEAMKQSGRAYALFDLARLVLNKPERHMVKLTRKREVGSGKPLELFLVQGSEGPFLSREEAIRVLFRRHADRLFTVTKKPVEPPKGTFTFVNRCGITGEILGPPNYHEYQSRLVRHHQHQLRQMPFEVFKARIETVKDPEAVKAWIESMSYQTEYVCVMCGVAADACPAPAARKHVTAMTDISATAEDAAVTPAEQVQQERTEATELGPRKTPKDANTAGGVVASVSDAGGVSPGTATTKTSTFASRAELERHVIDAHLGALVSAVPELRLSGPASRTIEHGAILEAIRSTWDRERRFPLETVNALRPHLQKQGLFFFKHGKGITYISRIKPRRFESSEGLTEHVKRIVAFIRAHEGCKRQELFAELQRPVTANEANQTNPQPAQESLAGESAIANPQSDAELLLADLHWLIQDGYVVEFYSGRLWSPEDRPGKAVGVAAADPSGTSSPGNAAGPSPAEAGLGRAGGTAPASETSRQ